MFRQLSDAEIEALIVRGRACVRMIEAATVLLEFHTDKFQHVTWGEARDLARKELRQMVAELPADVTGKIIAASEKSLGTFGDVGLN